MGILANITQYKENSDADQYSDVKLQEHNESTQSHADIRESIDQVAEGTGLERTEHKNVAGGYAGLNLDGKLNLDTIPTIGKNQLADDVLAHSENTDIHVSVSDKQNWNGKIDASTIDENGGVVGLNENGQVNDSVISSNIARVSELLQPDWNQTDDDLKDYIKNKPPYTVLPSNVSCDDVIEPGLYIYTETDSENLSEYKGLLIVDQTMHPEGYPYISVSQLIHFGNVFRKRYGNIQTQEGIFEWKTDWVKMMSYDNILQPDWNQTDDTSKDFIKNKPDLYTKTQVNSFVADKVSSAQINSIEVVDEYPDVEIQGVLYLKRVTT